MPHERDIQGSSLAFVDNNNEMTFEIFHLLLYYWNGSDFWSSANTIKIPRDLRRAKVLGS